MISNPENNGFKAFGTSLNSISPVINPKDYPMLDNKYFISIFPKISSNSDTKTLKIYDEYPSGNRNIYIYDTNGKLAYQNKFNFESGYFDIELNTTKFGIGKYFIIYQDNSGNFIDGEDFIIVN